ncbi:hypothetical protein D3C75_1260700 [compost metagenome]
MRLTSSRANSTWKYIGCSLHRVPSLSNTAMRSSTARKSLLPSLVTVCTNSVMAVFAGPSFQDARGSAACANIGSIRASVRP